MKNKKTIILREFQHLHYNKNIASEENSDKYIENTIFEEIKSFILKNSEETYFLKPAHKRNLGETLQAQNYVGVLQTHNGTTIEILPKIHGLDDDGKSKDLKNILIKMIRTLKKSSFKNSNMANLSNSNMPLFQVFITMFLDELAGLIKKV